MTDNEPQRAAVTAERVKCETCNKQGEWQKCGKCESVFYCSKECQTHDWPDHKKCCKLLLAKKKIVDTVIHISSRVIKDEYFTKTMKAIQRRKGKATYVDIDVSLLDPECTYQEMIKFLEIKEDKPEFSLENEHYNGIYQYLTLIQAQLPHNSFIIRGSCGPLEHWTICTDHPVGSDPSAKAEGDKKENGDKKAE